MRLEEFLKALEKCPDENLGTEWGISPSWPIFLNAPFGSVAQLMNQTDGYKFDKTLKDDDVKTKNGEGIRHLFDYVAGTVQLQISKGVHPFSTTGTGLNISKGDRIESERQLRDYKMTILLDPYQEKKMTLEDPTQYEKEDLAQDEETFLEDSEKVKTFDRVDWLRALAIVIYDIGQLAIVRNVSCCMPKSIGHKYLEDPNKYSRIAYHIIKTPAPSQKKS